jgi:hypothetical protein
MADQAHRRAVRLAGGVELAGGLAAASAWTLACASTGADVAHQRRIIAGSAARACASSGASAVPTAKVAPSTSAAVIVMLTCMPSRSTLRVWLAGLAGNMIR